MLIVYLTKRAKKTKAIGDRILMAIFIGKGPSDKEARQETITGLFVPYVAGCENCGRLFATVSGGIDGNDYNGVCPTVGVITIAPGFEPQRAAKTGNNLTDGATVFVIKGDFDFDGPAIVRSRATDQNLNKLLIGWPMNRPSALMSGSELGPFPIVPNPERLTRSISALMAGEEYQQRAINRTIILLRRKIIGYCLI